MDAGGPIVNFHSLRKRYGDGPLILDGISLDIHRGDFVTVIGPSGCGKSTLLRLISGLSEVTEGGLRVAGGTPEQARGQQAFLFQEATLLPWLTAEENITLTMRLRGRPAEEREARARELLDLVRLRTAAGQYPRQLSGGMKMRVSLARALALSPQLLLLDEPFGALDEMTRHHLNEELLALRERTPFTAIFVTHSVEEAVFLSNRIVVMAPAPGRVHAEVSVSFAYPRTAMLRMEAGFQHKVAEVTALLHAVEEGAVT